MLTTTLQVFLLKKYITEVFPSVLGKNPTTYLCYFGHSLHYVPKGSKMF